jgi:hypothetical protein
VTPTAPAAHADAAPPGTKRARGISNAKKPGEGVKRKPIVHCHAIPRAPVVEIVNLQEVLLELPSMSCWSTTV